MGAVPSSIWLKFLSIKQLKTKAKRWNDERKRLHLNSYTLYILCRIVDIYIIKPMVVVENRLANESVESASVLEPRHCTFSSKYLPHPRQPLAVVPPSAPLAKVGQGHLYSTPSHSLHHDHYWSLTLSSGDYLPTSLHLFCSFWLHFRHRCWWLWAKWFW